MTEEPAVQAKELSLRDLLSILRTRKAIVIQTFMVVVVVAVVVTMMTAPLYRSTARILVEGKETTLAQYNANDPLSNLFLPPAGHDVDTQIEVLQSPTTLQAVFAATGIRPKYIQLDVKQVGETDVIELDVTSPIRSDAERFAQVLPGIYLQNVNGTRKADITTALTFARGRLDEENGKLVQAELALERFKKRAGIVNTDTERTQDIAAANDAQADVGKAQGEVASCQAKLASLIAGRQSLSPFVMVPTRTTNNVQIETLKDQLAALRDQRAKLLFLYKPNDDQVQQVDLQIANLQQRLASTPSAVTTVSEMPNPQISEYDAKIADARAAFDAAQADFLQKRARAASLGGGLTKYNSIERSQAELERDVEHGQSMVAMLSKSVEDLSLREKATHDPILTIAPASRPIKVAPKPLSNLALGIMFGLLLGCCLAVLQDHLDDHISDPEDARRLLGAPILGHLPLVPSEQRRLLNLGRGNSHLFESFRVLRSNVQFTSVDGPIRILLVTSTVPGEGKSSTASNLSVVMALDNRRVILVDADLRRPRVNEIFDIDKEPGLTDVLVGKTPIEEALRDTEIPGLRVLPAGSSPPNPAELLNSPSMDQLLLKLKEISDIVIVDSPPCLATADAQVLAAKVDGVLYVMQIGEVRKSAVHHSFELLAQAHARVLGIVFNKVDRSSKTDRYYGYGYYDDKDEDDDDNKPTGTSRFRREIDPVVTANGPGNGHHHPGA